MQRGYATAVDQLAELFTTVNMDVLQPYGSPDLDADPDNTPAQLALNVAATSAKGAIVTIDGQGNIHYDPTAVAAFIALGQGQSTTDTITFTVTDPGNLQSTSQITVTVNGVNDAPVLQAPAGGAYTDTAAADTFANLVSTPRSVARPTPLSRLSGTVTWETQ